MGFGGGWDALTCQMNVNAIDYFRRNKTNVCWDCEWMDCDWIFRVIGFRDIFGDSLFWGRVIPV